MLLDLTRALKESGKEFPIALELALDPVEVLDDPVRFESVALAGHMIGAGESVSLKANVSATVYTRCSRCLCDVQMPLRASIEEIFTRAIDPDNPDIYPIDGSSVDIDPVVKDALLLELPMQFLCKSDCLGLCPACGKNRNEERCTCREGAQSANPFSALSELFKDNEEV